MKHKSNIAIAIFAVLFGGFIGYDPSTPSQNIHAGEFVIPHLVDVPKNGKELSLCIDLNKREVTVGEDSKDATVTIIEKNKDVETRPVYLTKLVEKEVYVENTIKSTRLINKLMPLEQPKLSLNLRPTRNGDRDQSNQAVYKSYRITFEGHRKCYDNLFRLDQLQND